mmetsp:Transcript_52824/g.110245  ORF Transcript_52824/g.110245 Transcript_52824/m.110245 type:complete len:144 (+) Transcript_52824:384-815(+)
MVPVSLRYSCKSQIPHSNLSIPAVLPCRKGAWFTDLCRALLQNTTLTELNLCENEITDEGATALAKTLESNVALKILNLNSTCIYEAGSLALAMALVHRSSELDLDGVMLNKATGCLPIPPKQFRLRLSGAVTHSAVQLIYST